MKAYNEEQQAVLASAAAAIKAAALEAITTIVKAKGSLAVEIRTQVTAMEKVGILQKDIAVTVRENVAGAASKSHISRCLTECGVRLRSKKRSDAGFLRDADAALVAAMEVKPAAIKDDDDGDDDSDDDGDDDGEGEGEGEGEGGGHTAETLAALLASIEPSIVSRALEIAGLA